MKKPLLAVTALGGLFFATSMMKGAFPLNSPPPYSTNTFHTGGFATNSARNTNGPFFVQVDGSGNVVYPPGGLVGGISTNSIIRSNGYGYGTTTFDNLVVLSNFSLNGPGASAVALTAPDATNKFRIKTGPMTTNVTWVGPTNLATGLVFGNKVGTNVNLSQLGIGTGLSSDGTTLTATNGGAVTGLTNAGGSISLINASNAPIPKIKSLSAGANATVTDQGTNLVIASTGAGNLSNRLDFTTSQPLFANGTNVVASTNAGSFIALINAMSNTSAGVTTALGYTPANITGNVSNDAVALASGLPLIGGGNGTAASTNAAAFRDLIRSEKIFNVLDYGAIAGDSTDDTTNIWNTIQAAKAAGGGTVYLPQGEYNWSNSVIDPSVLDASGVVATFVVTNNNITFKGDGMGRTILKPILPSGGALRNFMAVHNVTNFAVLDLSIDCLTNSSVWNTFDLSNNFNSFFLRCEFNGSQTDAVEQDHGDNTWIEDCVFLRNKANAIGAIGIDHCYISRCFIADGGTSTNYSALLTDKGEQSALQLRDEEGNGMIFVSDTIVSNYVNSVQVQARAYFNNCQFYTSRTNITTNVWLQTGQAIFNNCQFTKTLTTPGIYGVYVRTNFQADFNQCEFSGGPAMYLDHSTATKIQNSRFTISGAYSIYVIGGGKHQITGNRFYQNGNSALRFTSPTPGADGSTNCLIQGNLFEDGGYLSDSGSTKQVIQGNTFLGAATTVNLNNGGTNYVIGNVFDVSAKLTVGTAGNVIQNNTLSLVALETSSVNYWTGNKLQNTALTQTGGSQITNQVWKFNTVTDGSDYITNNILQLFGGYVGFTNAINPAWAYVSNGVFYGSGAGLTSLPAGLPGTNTVIAYGDSNRTNSLSVTAVGTIMTNGQLVLHGAGSATKPLIAFGEDNDSTSTGIYRSAANAMAFTANGAATLSISAGGTLTVGATWSLGQDGRTRAGSGSAALPSLSFFDDNDSGWYRSGASDLRFSVDAVDQIKMTANGIGSLATNQTLTVAATGITNTLACNYVLYGFTGTSVFQTNATGQVINRGTLTNGVDIVLKPGGVLVGTSCAAQGDEAW